MNIPYIVEERPDSGLTNGKLGTWLFLASEVMLFGALFSTYIILRVGSEEWPHGELNVWLGMANTFILIGSSVTMVMAWASLKLNDFAKHRLYLILTVVLSGLFELRHVREGGGASAGATALATLLAFITGYASIAFLLRYLVHHTIGIFAAYRIVLGLIVLVLAATNVIN